MGLIDLGGVCLQRLFSTFPASWPGVGLLLLRLAIAPSVIVDALILQHWTRNSLVSVSTIDLVGIILAIGLIAGLLTPVVSVLVAIINGVTCVSGLWESLPDSKITGFTTASLTVVSLALAFLGPGALSLDARLYGRREIIIPVGHEPPTSPKDRR